jgi:hypothetical protein
MLGHWARTKYVCREKLGRGCGLTAGRLLRSAEERSDRTYDVEDAKATITGSAIVGI